MRMLKTPLWMSLLLVLSLPGSLSAGIYKWIDDEGKVHFGDAPPAASESETIRLKPVNTSQGLKKVEESPERLKGDQKPLEDPADDNPEQVLQPVPTTGPPPDVACFTPLADALGGRIPDTGEAVKARTLTSRELKQLETLFKSGEGRWKGKMEDVTCLREGASPPSTTAHYDYRLKARWKAGRRFEIDTELESKGSKDSLERQLFLLQLDQTVLRFRESKSDIFSDINTPQYDVEILSIGTKGLQFFTRLTGVHRKTKVYSFHMTGQSFQIREFFFSQGILSAKRIWKAE